MPAVSATSVPTYRISPAFRRYGALSEITVLLSGSLKAVGTFCVVAARVYAGIKADIIKLRVVPASVLDQIHKPEAVTVALAIAANETKIPPSAPAVSSSTELVTVVLESTPLGVKATAAVATADAVFGVCPNGAVNVFAMMVLYAERIAAYICANTESDKTVPAPSVLLVKVCVPIRVTSPTSKSPEPSKDTLLIVLMLVPDTSAA